jgi:hypothetical protein
MARNQRGQAPEHARKLLATPRKMDTLIRTVHEDGIRGRWMRWGKIVPTSSMLSTTVVLRDVGDRIVSDRGRRFNVAAAIAIFTAMLVEVPPGWLTQFVIRHQGRVTLDDPTLFATDDVLPLGLPDTTDWVHERTRLLDTVRDTSSWGASDVGLSVMRVDLGYGMIDITLQVANDELYMHAAISRMDVIRILPHVMFVLAMLHEHLSRQIGISAGPMTMAVGELLVQSDDTKVYLEPSDVSRWPHKMRAMPRIASADLEMFRLLVGTHLTLPSFDILVKAKQWRTPSAMYLLDLAKVMRAYLLRHANHGIAAATLQEVSCQTLRYVLRPWLGLGVRPDEPARARIDATPFEVL